MSAPDAFSMEHAEPRENPRVLFLQTLALSTTTAETQLDQCLGMLKASKDALEKAATDLTRLAAEKKEIEAASTRLTVFLEQEKEKTEAAEKARESAQEGSNFLLFMIKSILVQPEHRSAILEASERAQQFFASQEKPSPVFIQSQLEELLALLPLPTEARKEEPDGLDDFEMVDGNTARQEATTSS